MQNEQAEIVCRHIDLLLYNIEYL